jgi:hypothetical protein
MVFRAFFNGNSLRFNVTIGKTSVNTLYVAYLPYPALALALPLYNLCPSLPCPVSVALPCPAQGSWCHWSLLFSLPSKDHPT